MVQQAPDDVGWDTWLEPSSLHALMSSPVHQPLLAAVLTWLHGRLVENAAFRDVTFGIVPMTFLGLGRYVVIGLRVPAGRDPEKIRKEVEAHVDELVARATLREFLDVAARTSRSYDDVVAELFAALTPGTPDREGG